MGYKKHGMEGIMGILGVLVYIVTFLLSYINLFLCFKSEKKLNGVTWLMLSFVFEICIGAFFAGIVNIINIPVNMWSMGCINLIPSVFVWFYYREDRRVQQYQWDCFDVVYLIILAVAFTVFLICFKGGQIQLKFYNSDAAVHFKNAMTVVRSERLPTMYFSELWMAMTIRCFLPITGEINAYKIFILVDHFFLFLEVEMFMVILREYAATKKEKVLAVFFSAFYALGYPMLGYLFSFFYWGIGVLLLGSLLLYAKYYREKQIGRSMLVLALMVTCNAITMCYMLFGPLSFFMLFLCLAYIYWEENHKLDLSWVALCLKIFFLPTVFAAYYCFFIFLVKENLSIGEVIKTSGGTYVERYVSFLWVVPLGIYMFVYCIRKRKIDTVMISGIWTAFVVAVFKLLCRGGYVSFYYASKFFYPLWLFGFIIAFQAACKLLKWNRKLLTVYLAVVLLLTMGYFYKYERKMVVQEVDDVQNALLTDPKLSLYGYNYGLYRVSHVQYLDEYLEVCSYVLEQLKEEKVPMVVGVENYSHCYWFEAITGMDSSEYYGWTQDFSDIQDKLDSQDVNYFVVYKNTYLYMQHQDYFEAFTKVYDNGQAMICSTAK